MCRMCDVACLHYIDFFLFLFFPHLADSHPSYPPSMCVKREPHEASFAPFTPSSVGDSALADILPSQCSLSVDASTPSYPVHAHGPCYSQFASQPFIAGTTPRTVSKSNPALISVCISHLSHFSSRLKSIHCSRCYAVSAILLCGPAVVYTAAKPRVGSSLTALSPPFHPAFQQL